MDTITRISETLTQEKQKIRKENQKFQGRNGEVLQKLANKYGITAEKITPTPTTAHQNVSTPTSPTQVHISPRTHQHVTQAKTPGIIPTGPKLPSEHTLTQHS